jgi:hypothetical protein
MEHYKTENKKLRKKIKELKSLLTTKSKWCLQFIYTIL